jgi:hypothetical protein
MPLIGPTFQSPMLLERHLKSRTVYYGRFLNHCEGVGFVDKSKGEDRPKERDLERVLDCLSLGLCHLFK